VFVTNLPSVDDVLDSLDRKNKTEVDAAEAALFKAHGLDALVPVLTEACPRMRHAMGRCSILFWLVRYARRVPGVVDLAVASLDDRAYLVRMHSCSILAYSLRHDVLPHLQRLLQHAHQATRADAAAAIDAIEQQNHHYWFDRDHSGEAFWTLESADGGNA
jgi:hypothetical protein